MSVKWKICDPRRPAATMAIYRTEAEAVAAAKVLAREVGWSIPVYRRVWGADWVHWHTIGQGR